MAMRWAAVFIAAAAMAQTASDTPSFEAASIKRNRTMSNSRNGIKSSPGRVTIENMPFLDILEECYRLSGYQVQGAPGWLGSETYDIAAASKESADRVRMIEMLKTTMEDRLQLRFHWESGETNGFALEVSKSGPKFHEFQPASDGTPQKGEIQGLGHLRSPKLSMLRLSGFLSIFMQVPVLDRTNLAGEYGIDLQYTRDAKDQADVSAPPPIVTAVEDQLGLKLVKQKVPVKLFVIDRVERPLEN